MGFFKWLYRLPGRIDKSMEQTALASSVVQSEGIGGTHPNMIGVKAVIAEIDTSERRDGGSEHPQGR